MKNSKAVLAKRVQCTGCMACHDVCRHEAIRIVEKNCMPYVVVNEDKCVGCGLCQKVCPVVSPVRKNKPEEMKVYGGWATEEATRVDAASGGAFTGIARSFFHLHENGKVCVVGAALENNRVRHLAVEPVEDLRPLMNSKYIQSDTVGIYESVGEKLRNGYWVLFSGCPCQIAGLYGYLGKRRDDERLVTVEVVCHGIASYEALDLHLKHYKSSKIYRFRDKRLYTQDWKYSQCTTIEQAGQPVKLKRKHDTFYAIYAGWLLDRKSCSDCQFASFDRVADITLADFWGLSVPEYYKQGVSLIIANNAKADSLIKSADSIYIFEGSYKTAIGGNPNLFTGYKFIKYHPMVLWPGFFRRILPEKLRFDILTNKMPWKLLRAFYKISTLCLIKCRRKKLIKKLERDKKLSHLLKNIDRGGVKWPIPNNNQ